MIQETLLNLVYDLLLRAHDRSVTGEQFKTELETIARNRGLEYDRLLWALNRAAEHELARQG